jgi:hypothetical protein
MEKVVHMKNLLLTRKPEHEICDIRRAAIVTHTSMVKIQKALDEFGVFEDKFYIVAKVN